MPNNPLIGSLDLDTTSQGSVKRSSNLTGGEKFANVLDEGADAVGNIAGGLASVFPGGGAVLSAVASGLSSVTGSGPFGAGSSSFGGLLSGVGVGGGYAGAMGGGGVGGGFGGIGSISAAATGGGAAGVAASQNSGYQQQLSMLKLQQQAQSQAEMISIISAILNIEHSTAMSIIQNIH